MNCGSAFFPRSRIFRPLLYVTTALTSALLNARGDIYDVLIQGGRLLDGTGAPWRYADVAIIGDHIVFVGAIPSTAKARQTIDARGLYVAPGFIDAHSHAASGLLKPALTAAEPLLTQGLTTVFANPDGEGPTDLPLQRRSLQSTGISVNVAQLIGHNSVRIAVLGYENRAPTEAELMHMADLVRQGMQAGAFGLSAGPFYVPGSYSKTDEHVALARVAAEFGGFYTSHIRDESSYNIGVIAAVDEVVTIARDGGLPGIITHIKVSGPTVAGFSEEIIRRINAARAAGVEIWADQYPYEASSTSLGALLLPPWAQEGGAGALLARLEQSDTRERIRTAVVENLVRRGGAGTLQISNCQADPSINGKHLDAVARSRHAEPADAAIDIFRVGGASVVSFNMTEQDIRAFMMQPWTMTCSDASLVALGEGVPHPRAYGTFPRKIRRYVVEQKVLTLEQAIHSMTGLPAAVFGLKHRGLLDAGAWADVVVFDLGAIRDRATYEKPHQLSEGLRHVFVNGSIALTEGRVTGTHAGRVLIRGAP